VQVTLVGYYGPKPPPLEHWIRSLQAQLAQHLGNAFLPYTLEQVHTTLIGLEGFQGDNGSILSTHYQTLRGELRPIHLEQCFDFLRTSPLLPFEVQLGGFNAYHDYGFCSQGQHPYHRSFSLQGAIAVVMGWPIQHRHYPATLDALRKAFNPYNLLHKYHPTPDSIDNDCFWVLGQVNSSQVSQPQRQAVQDAMRVFLAQQTPLILPMGREHLSVVLYEQPQLPWGQCYQIPLRLARLALRQISAAYAGGASKMGLDSFSSRGSSAT
jgi:hypothetical protein